MTATGTEAGTSTPPILKRKGKGKSGKGTEANRITFHAAAAAAKKLLQHVKLQLQQQQQLLPIQQEDPQQRNIVVPLTRPLSKKGVIV